MENLWNGIIK